MIAVVVQMDLRGKFGPARDQGLRPTCLAFAVSDARAAARAEEWSELSCEYLYYHAAKRQGVDHTAGVKIEWVRAALETDGQPLEEGWPYLANGVLDPKKWKPPAKVGDLFRRASKKTAAGFERAWRKVTGGTPVLIGMSISDAFFMPKAGVVDSAEPIDPSRRHAVVAVATGEQGGARYLLVRNSWGEGWGVQGYAWVAERYMTPRVLEMITIN